MSDQDHEAFDALRRLDGPRDIDPEVMTRIEDEVLARFDDAAERPAHAAPDGDLIPLDGRRREVRHRAPWWPIAAAAAAAVLVVGLFVVQQLRDDDPQVPSTQPTADPDPRVAEQIETYCETYVRPLNDALAIWTPSRSGGEARGDVLGAVEQAAQGLADLPGPAASLFVGRGDALVLVAADARLATAVSDDADAAIVAAVDRLYAELEAVPQSAGTVACARPSG